MVKRKFQVGYDKNTKTPIFEELTYEFFSQHIGYEGFFYYGNQTIDIACHGSFDNVVYELNINGDDEDKAIRYEFNSPEELLKNGKIDGKTLKEIWEDLEN